MAKMSDAGISVGGNFVKPEDLLNSGKVFVIVGAAYREAHDEFGEQVNLTLRYETPDENGNEEIVLSLGLNPVRAKLLTYFEENSDPINGIDAENGLILIRGDKANKGNKPYIFADAPVSGASDLPF